MIRLNIHEAKAHLSRYLERVAAGEVVVICRRNAPIAELRAVPEASTEKRPVGLGRGTGEFARDFDDPLPADVLRAFEGHEP